MYGLFDHDKYGADPFALISAHPGENVHDQSRAYNSFRRYLEHDIGGVLHCSPQEFFSMPPEYVRLVFKLVTERKERKRQTEKSIMDNLENQARNGNL